MVPVLSFFTPKLFNPQNKLVLKFDKWSCTLIFPQQPFPWIVDTIRQKYQVDLQFQCKKKGIYLINCLGSTWNSAEIPHCPGAQDGKLQVPLWLLSQTSRHQGPYQGSYQDSAVPHLIKNRHLTIISPRGEEALHKILITQSYVGTLY